ncbi:MAG: ATP-binding cassette domain-containing protein, partial [Negativicutes bacterium]|nr:ATP-binding cassette domain-containing protein [Negativicutes bacterium]
MQDTEKQPMATSSPSPAGESEQGYLQASDITKQYATVPVLAGVDITLRPGRIHTIIGENGAGKSTLLKILSGLVQPTVGSLRLHGRPIVLASPRAAHQHGIYLVPQEPALMAE